MKNIVSISITDTFEKKKKRSYRISCSQRHTQTMNNPGWNFRCGRAVSLDIPTSSPRIKSGLATKPDDVFHVISRKCRKRRGTRLCHEARKHGIRIAWPKTLTMAHSSDFILENQLHFLQRKKKEKKTIIKELFWILLFPWKLEIKEKFLKWIFLVYIINKINWCFLSIYYLYNTWNQLGYLIKYLYGINHTKIYTLFPLWKKKKGFAGNKCYLMFNMLWWLKVLYFKLFIEIMKNE